MDIFDALSAISKKKKAFMYSGLEHEALIKAELDVSKGFQIRLFDIKKLVNRLTFVKRIVQKTYISWGRSIYCREGYCE
jgi:hypothetical protein